MNTLAGTTPLTGLALRRDRTMLAIWLYAFAAFVGATVYGFRGLYPTAAGREEFALTANHNPALLSIYGPFYGTSLGSFTAWRDITLAGVLAGLMVVAENAPFGREVFLAREAFGIPEVKQQVEVAVLLSRLCTPQASVGVFHAGTVPYYTDLRGIDFLGKTDPHVARSAPDLHMNPGHNRSDLGFSIGRRRPDYVEGFSWGADRVASDDYERVGPLWLRRGSPNVRWDLVRGGPGATSP